MVLINRVAVDVERELIALVEAVDDVLLHRERVREGAARHVGVRETGCGDRSRHLPRCEVDLADRGALGHEQLAVRTERDAIALRTCGKLRDSSQGDVVRARGSGHVLWLDDEDVALREHVEFAVGTECEVPVAVHSGGQYTHLADGLARLRIVGAQVGVRGAAGVVVDTGGRADGAADEHAGHVRIAERFGLGLFRGGIVDCELLVRPAAAVVVIQRVREVAVSRNTEGIRALARGMHGTESTASSGDVDGADHARSVLCVDRVRVARERRRDRGRGARAGSHQRSGDHGGRGDEGTPPFHRAT